MGMELDDHKIADGEIQVVSVINPCFYWVRCHDCPSLQDLHSILDSFKPVPVSSVTLGDKVVIKKFGDLGADQQISWYRAIISSYDELDGMYDVYLPDDMTAWRLDSSSIYTIDNPRWERIPTLHVIGLHGGVPVVTNSDAQESTQNILKSHKETVLEFSWVSVQQYHSNKVVFGNVALKTPRKTVNLLTHLIRGKMAIYQQDYFQVLEDDGWLNNLEKEIGAIKMKLNPHPCKEKKPKKVLNVLPPPSDLVDKARLAELMLLSPSARLEDRILPMIKTESHEEHNDRMRRSALLLEPNKCVIPNSESEIFRPIDLSHAESPKPPRSLGRGLFVQKVPYNTTRPRSANGPCTNSQEASGQFDDASHGLANELLIRDPTVLKIKTSDVTFQRPSEVSKDRPSNGFSLARGVILQPDLEPKVPTLLDNSCQPNPSPGLGRGIFVSKQLGTERDGRVLPSTPANTTTGLPDPKSVPAPTPSSGSNKTTHAAQRSNRNGIKSNGIAAGGANAVKTHQGNHPAVLKMKTSDVTCQRRSEVSKDRPSTGFGLARGVILQPDLEPKVPTSLKDSCQPNPSPGFGKGTFSSKPLETELDGRKLPSTPANTTTGLPDPKSVPAPTPSSGSNETTNAAQSSDHNGIKSNGIAAGGANAVKTHRDNHQAVLKKKTSDVTCQRRSEVSKDRPSTGFGLARGVILQPDLEPKVPTLLKDSCQPNPSPGFGKGTFSSKPLGTELDGRKLPSTPANTTTDLPDPKSVPAPTPSSGSNETTNAAQSSYHNGIKSNGIAAGGANTLKTHHGNHLFSCDDEYGGVDVAAKSLNEARGLVFGEGASEIQVASHLGDLNLDRGISDLARRAQLMTLTRPQSLAMPTILERRDVILVGPNRSKKTSAYLVPLMSLLRETKYYSVIPPGNGPRCVIVAPTSDRVKVIGQLCSQYGGHLVKTITTYGGGLETERANELAAGCDILVTTPRCWLRLMKCAFVTNARRLCHLVLDRFDVLDELFSEELHKIIMIVRALLSERCKKGKGWELLGVQTIVSCAKWTPTTEQYSGKVMNKPILVFTSFVECAVLSRIKPALILTHVDAKVNSLKELIDKFPSSKIAIACNMYDDVIAARDAVYSTDRNSSVVVAHEKMPSALLNQIAREWRLKEYPVLIFSDLTVHDFSITDANVLIHFAVSPSKSSFGERFITIRDGIVQAVLNRKDVPQTTVHIMGGLEEPTSATAFPFIVDYLERLNIKIPPNIMDLVRYVKRHKEFKDARFCENILQTGRCHDEEHCRWRHVLRETDQDDLDFTQGLLKLTVCHIHSAVKFSVRVLEYNPHPSGDGPWIKYKTHFSRITQLMSTFFSSRGNRRSHGLAQVGDVVAYLEDDGGAVFHRARVVDVVERDNHNDPKVVSIYSMDFGYDVDTSITRLYELPENLKKYPDQCESVYLANLKPVDLDASWSVVACNTVEDAIVAADNELTENDEILARLLFRFDNKAVIDNLRWVKRQKRVVTFALDLRQTILSTGSGLANPVYSKTLEKLFQEASLDYYVMKDVQVPKIEEKKEPPSWAHLPTEPHVYTNVKIHDTVSPSRFYVQLCDFQDELLNLQRDIQAAVSGSPTPLLNRNVGDVCITRNTQDPCEWNRCKIVEVDNETASVLFVDYGKISNVTVDHLFEIPWKFVTRLPFQAIECSLAGVKPSIVSDAEWCEEAVNEFVGLIVNNRDYSDAYVKVLGTEKTAERTGGRRYDVVVVADTFCVNETLNFGVRTIDDFEVDLNEFLKLNEDGLSPNQDDAPSDADTDTDDWNTPYVPPQPRENVQRCPAGALPIDVDEAEVFGIEAFVERLFPALLPKFKESQKELKSIEGVPSDAAQQYGLTQHEEVNDSCKSACQEEVPETGKDGAVPAAVRTPPPVANAVEDLPAETPEVAAWEQVIPHKTPKVCWLQDKDTLTLRFMIPCLTTYQLRFTTSSVTLIASAPDLYLQKIFFFGCVSGVYEEKEGASYLSVKLRKLVSGYDWPRLTLLETSDKRICYVGDDAGDDEYAYDSLIPKYVKRAAASHQTFRLPEEDVGVEPGYLVTAPDTNIDSDDELIQPYKQDYQPFKIGTRDEFDPLAEF